jgi:membrane associated rhomboid family serine protease
MTEASVGFQCPECVREGQKSMRPARTVFGGRVSREAVLTRLLIGLNVAAFAYELAVGQDRATIRFGMHPLSVAQGEYYRLVTSAFLHFGIIHIAFNMYALYMLGSQVERAVGRARFLALYLTAALGGSTLSYLLSSPKVLGAGASGAVYGLFGAYFVIARRLRMDTTQIVGLIGINLFISFAIPSIDWRAHIGGLIVGGGLMYAFAHLSASRRRDLLHAAAVAGTVVVLLVAIGVRTSRLRQDAQLAGNLSASSAATTSAQDRPSR